VIFWAGRKTRSPARPHGGAPPVRPRAAGGRVVRGPWGPVRVSRTAIGRLNGVAVLRGSVPQGWPGPTPGVGDRPAPLAPPQGGHVGVYPLFGGPHRRVSPSGGNGDPGLGEKAGFHHRVMIGPTWELQGFSGRGRQSVPTGNFLSGGGGGGVGPIFPLGTRRMGFTRGFGRF